MPATAKKKPAALAPRVTKRELTVAEAADQFVDADLAMEAQKARKQEAAAVLKAYFERTGRTKYKHLVELRQGSDRTVLDQDAVKEFLGERLPEFQTRVTPAPSVSRIKT
jgi:hypothetical protein